MHFFFKFIFVSALSGDLAFHEDRGGPLRIANARLVRYADDFVVMARYMGERIGKWIESELEKDLGLEVNREKTSIVRMNKPGGNPSFLGFTMRYDRDLHGRDSRCLNLFPSEKAVHAVREKLLAVTGSGFKAPPAEAIGKVNSLCMP